MKAPKIKIYTVILPDVNIPKMKIHLRKFRATRVSVLESEDISSVIFNVSLSKVSNVWTYLRKKQGIKNVWLGR